MINASKKTKQIAGLKIKPKPTPATKELYVDDCKPYSSTGLINTQSSFDPSAQYQRQKVIQNTVQVSSSLYLMNKASLNVFQSQYSDSVTASANATTNANMGWNQMSDRKEPHIQKEAISMKSSVSLRPGNMTPGGAGCDIKHNSYHRYLAKLKGSAPLRKEALPADYGANVPFDPANPVYGGKTVKTSIGESDCTICVIKEVITPIIKYNFIYSFTYTGEDPIPPDATAFFLQYLPLLNDNDSFTFTLDVQIATSDLDPLWKDVTITMNYSFESYGSNYDGFTFNPYPEDDTITNFYNNNTFYLRILSFGNIPLSRAGHQFQHLLTLPIFPAAPQGVLINPSLLNSSDVPQIIVNSSLSYCFANIREGFGTDNATSDYILSWDIKNALDTSYMFYNSSINSSKIYLNITNIVNLEGMFELTDMLDPDEIILSTNPSDFPLSFANRFGAAFSPYTNTLTMTNNYKIAKARPRPKPVPKINSKSLFSKSGLGAKAKKFTYFAAKGPQMYRTSTGFKVSDPITVDTSYMFYECANFQPEPVTFSFTATPIDTSYMFFNAPLFNAPLPANDFVTTLNTDISYMFSGASSFNQPISNWNLSNLESSVNAFSNSAITPNNMPNYFSFNYEFVYTGTAAQDFRQYVPILNFSMSFDNTIVATVEPVDPLTNIVKVVVTFKFTDNGTTNDGLTFNIALESSNLTDFYNNYTTGLTITQFGGMNLSRAGYQFANLNSLQITDPVAPSIVPNTLFINTFANAPTFNSDITLWDTSGVINMDGTFNGATVFNQDISVWDVSNVTTHVDFAKDSALSYGPSFPIPPEGFIYTFVYQGTLSNAELEDYIPVKRLDNTFTTFTPIITKSPANLVTVQIEFTFVDNGTTNDGLMFDFNNAANNNVALFYNDPLVSGLTIKQFGYSYFMPLTRGQSAPQGRQFYNLIKDFKINAIQPPQILSNTSLASCFSAATNIGYSVFNSDISNWVTTNVVDMNRMFYYSTYFNQNINTNNTTGTWITSNVINMSNMFAGANGFNLDIYDWDVSQVVNMSSMFNNTSVFNKNISTWDVSNVTNMARMFQDSQEFNQDISTWDVSNVTNMTGMFQYSQAFNQDISGWMVDQVTSYAEFYLDAVALDPLNVPLKFR